MTQQPFSRLVAKDQDTNRIVQDIYDKLTAVLSSHTATVQQVGDLTTQLEALKKVVAGLTP